MTTDLPNDLIAFLRAGRQLDYDVDNSEIGRIKLKRDTDLSLTTITTFPGCQSIIDDPYSDLDGLYHIDVYDLVAESEDYETEGLLCWIVALKRLGCVDPEHGDVITFPDVTWTELVANPLAYLDAQWFDHDAAVRVLPWTHFSFRLIASETSASETIIPPYGQVCPIHDAPITVARENPRPAVFSVLRERNLDGWLRSYLTEFPCSGVPVNDHDVLRCEVCRDAEHHWIKRIDDAIKTIDVRQRADGWIQCPGCGIRSAWSYTDAFRDGRCLTCGQKINVLEDQCIN